MGDRDIAIEVEHWALSVKRWTLQVSSPESRPIIACYCATFLKPEMFHIYRQITALKRCAPVVIAQKREQTERFPFDDVEVIPKPATHFLRRFWHRQLRDMPWQISDGELSALLCALSRIDASVLHIYFGQIAVHLLPLIRAWKKPSIVSFHGADVTVEMNKPAYRQATREMLAAVKLVLVRSESLRRALTELGCDETKIALQRTGIPLEEFPFRERSFPQDDEWRLVQAGRLIEKKGLPVTLNAFAVFLDRYPNATLTIAGEGPLLDELQKLTRELNIEERVSFTGFVSQEQLREIYYRSHIFLHPSQIGRDGNQEGVPNSMLEAMASGLPVFATEHGGIPEAIENAVSGVLVREHDHEALSRALLSATQDLIFLSRIARSAAEVVRKNFDLRTQAQRLDDIYLQIIGRDG
ncbi:MAG: colanic acid biosynthesis glycosyltransferase WcaL [Verrucomicrobia bacterium]|nr:MAG: colanic acid biosynthesis glycosyltransferase WcaL [Verrucomicrobiota bacterium]